MVNTQYGWTCTERAGQEGHTEERLGGEVGGGQDMDFLKND